MGKTLFYVIGKRLAKCESEAEEGREWQRIFDEIVSYHRSFEDNNTSRIPVEDVGPGNGGV